MEDEPRTGTDAAIHDAVRRVWGFDTLRPLQAASIALGVEGRDGLTVLPTGGGKSLCYQVPPLVTGKATIVVSPLIALMRDQVRGLELAGYPAAALHSAVEPSEARAIEKRLLDGELLLLLAAPERVVTHSFMSLLARLADTGKLGSVAIDEAHCISQWGHDFRPEYRRLAEVRTVAPGVPMQAFTATATPRVRDDIVAQLGLDGDGAAPKVLVGRFDRPNLSYRVHTRKDAAAQTAEAVRRHLDSGDGGGAIVYCLSRKDTETLADKLCALRVDARAYHAGLNPGARHDIEEAFTNESLGVVVATVAFGMGIDRSNVRLVVHACMPKSIEAYQQETGRAGRDGLEAECLLLYAPSDAGRWERLIQMNANESGDGEAAEAQVALVRTMRRLVTSMACRHAQLSEHFGQDYEPPEGSTTGCGACDVCLGETEAEADPTRIAQVLLSAVARCEQRSGCTFGATHICDVVRGADTERIRQRGHDGLSVFGLLKDRAKAEVLSFIDQLVSACALERAIDGQFETLRFGPRGVAVIKGEDTIPLARPVGAGAAKRERRRGRGAVDAAPLGPEDLAVFERLRALRRAIATERAVPPYVVFSDATLREMATRRPSSPESMLEVKGVGAAKLESFGDRFLEALGAASAVDLAGDL